MAKILVIEDDQFYQEMLCTVLEKHGHQVTTATDGEIAYSKFSKTLHDIIICDLIMPNMDGMEFIMKIRISYPNAKIIAISGGDKSLSAQAYLSATKDIGADRVFQKPMKNSDILKAIDELVDD